MNINKSELFSKVLMNILFMSIFIGMFFFTYGVYIEKQVIKNQMDFLANNFSNITKILGKNVFIGIGEKINKIILPDLSHEDKLVKQYNKQILMKVLKINLIAIFIVFSILYYINKNYNNGTYSLKEILQTNLIILVCIALTEFCFITFFGAHYISIEPNKILLTILTNLKKNKYI